MTSRLSDPINPGYYKRNGLEAIDVIEAFFMHSPHLATAFKYLARMGEKPGNSLEQDAEKAKWYIDRWVEFHSKKTVEQAKSLYGNVGSVPQSYDRMASDKENTDWNGGQ